jgi:hypothetical protein
MKHLALNRQAVTEIYRERKLPFPGQVLVELGQSVHPEDWVAEAELPSEIFCLDIARGLGVDPSEVVSYLVRDLGETLAKDDVIAECDIGLLRLMRVPKGGKLLTCRDGVAFIAAGKKTVGVRAGMIGVVSTILPELGVILKAQGGLIQAVWGNGRVGAGILRVQTSPLREPISTDELKKYDEGQVIAAGIVTDQSELKAIVEREPTGLILGSIQPSLITQVLALSFPVVLLGGLGELPPDQHAFELLKERNGEVVCINGSQPDILGGEWPEVIIPNAAGEIKAPLPFQTDLRIGQRVQALSGIGLGGVFTVSELPDEAITLESGLACKPAILHSEEGESISLPRENLLILDA